MQIDDPLSDDDEVSLYFIDDPSMLPSDDETGPGADPAMPPTQLPGSTNFKVGDRLDSPFHCLLGSLLST